MRADREDPKYEPEMPVVAAGEHLLGYLYDVGPTIAGGVLTHLEVWAWQQNTGIRIEPWEVRVLRRLSSEYMVMAYEATKKDCQAPWSIEQDLNATAKKLKLAIRNLATL